MCSTVQQTSICSSVSPGSATYSLVSRCVTSYACLLDRLSRLKRVLKDMVNFFGIGSKVNGLECS